MNSRISMDSYDVGAVLDALYFFERNVRIQNAPPGFFYGCATRSPIFYKGLEEKDFDTPEGAALHVSTAPQFRVRTWYFANSLEQLCSYLFSGEAKGDRRFIEYIEASKPTALEKSLNDAHNRGHKFIIESLWDSGYDVFFLPKGGTLDEVQEFNSVEPGEMALWITEQTLKSGENSA